MGDDQNVDLPSADAAGADSAGASAAWAVTAGTTSGGSGGGLTPQDGGEDYIGVSSPGGTVVLMVFDDRVEVHGDLVVTGSVTSN